MHERLPCSRIVNDVMRVLLAAHGQQGSTQTAQAAPTGASSTTSRRYSPQQLTKLDSWCLIHATIFQRHDRYGLRTAVATALSQQQGAGDIYAAQLEQAAGIINGFTSTPLQFGTLGSVHNYITQVVQPYDDSSARGSATPVRMLACDVQGSRAHAWSLGESETFAYTLSLQSTAQRTLRCTAPHTGTELTHYSGSPVSGTQSGTAPQQKPPGPHAMTRQRSQPVGKVYGFLFMLLAAQAQQISAQVAQAVPTVPGASTAAVPATVSAPSPSPLTQQAIATMLAAAFGNAAGQVSGAGKILESGQGQSAASTPAAAVAPMPAIDAAKYPELAALLATKTNGSDPLGLRTAVATALSQQQGAGDTYAAQLEQAAGVINGFTTPVTFGTLGSVRNYITRVIQINTLLGAIQRYLQPTSQLALQRLITDGIRLAINFVTTFPVAYLVYESRVYIALRDAVRIPRDSIGLATQIINLVILVSTNPVNFSAINAGVGPGGLFASFPGATTAFGFGKRLLQANDESAGMAATQQMLEGADNFQDLVAHLAAAGMTTRDLLGVSTESSAAPSMTDAAASAPVATEEEVVAQVYDLSNKVNDMLGNVQGLVDSVVPRLTLLTNDSAVAEIDFQKPNSADAVFNAGKLLRSSADAVAAATGRFRQTIFGLPPVTTVPPQNIGTGANGLPAGVIGLPAVPALGLPGIPFPGGFPPIPPPLNAAVLNLLRTVAASLVVANNILNLIQTVLETIADLIAVIPTAIALVTGPILFAISSLDYYNNLVASFPAVPNGYLGDLNIALGGLGSVLTGGNVFLGAGTTGALGGALSALTGASATLGTTRAALTAASG
ncbi:hypothetical protein QJQ45_016717 [Haematococcus lacustris]|nr:hypothetical protein QJQ45_016717 [Haematococcus lacustris]